MKRIFYFALFCLMFGFAFLPTNSAKFVCYAENEQESLLLAENAKSAYLIEKETNTVLFSKNENENLPIASMTKMMSLSVIFDAINDGKLKLEDKVTVSENAAKTEGSQAFLDAGASYSVSDLIKTIVISSANDSTVALSEKVAGNEKIFATLMNKKAKELNLNNSSFKNSTGLPEDGHYSSAKDCAIIYKSIIDNPIYLKFANIWMDKLVHPSGRETELVNTNRLVKTYQGCTSGKTGYTSEAGYCLTTSATRAGTTLIGVVIGEKDSKVRFSEVKEMLDYGFANFKTNLFLNSKENKQMVKVNGGKKENLEACLKEDYYVFSKINQMPELNVNYVINNVSAPVKVGDKVGTAIITNKDGVVLKEIDIVSREEVKKQTLLDVISKISNKW